MVEIRRRSRLALIGILLVVGQCSTAKAAESLEPMHSMVGNFSCVTRAASGPAWHFSTVNVLYGSWLRLDATYPAQNGTAQMRAVTFTGFDQSLGHWEIISIHDNGTFYSRRSDSKAFGRSEWIDDNPPDGARAQLKVVSDTWYSFDLTVPGAHGSAAASHTSCTRVESAP
jgi:hypothetical protein